MPSIDLLDLISPDDPRLAIVREGSTADAGECVLLWVQRAQRATGNFAANQAIELADRLDLPVVAVFCLVPDFPRATHRTYRFMAEGLAELPAAFARRGIGWELRVGAPESVIPALASALGAAVVVADQNPLRLGREWRSAVAARLQVPLLAVDADVVVPSSLLPREEWAARTIRPKIQRFLPDHLKPIENPQPCRRSNHRAGPDSLTAIEELPLDRGVAPVDAIRGGTMEARRRLKRFVDERLERYDTDRNRAHLPGQSGLSPYLHYGQIASLEVALAVHQAGQHGTPAAAVESFLDELIVQRELGVNFALRNPDYDRYTGLPDWGRKTLAAHARDPRPDRYDRATLVAGETGDRLWNAAQRQLVEHGSMPNRLRMYWAKQFLRWTESPEAAFEIAVELNDRYYLDGRDAASYSNIAWSIGGRHDRPFPPDKPIFGLVRPMGLGAMNRSFDVDAYIDGVARGHAPG